MAIQYYFANWKMYQSFTSVQQFVKNYKKNEKFKESLLTKYVGIAASYEQLYFVQQKLKRSGFFFGAQDCSSHLQGAYTGQVSVQSLSQLHMSFCIIGHSEVRNYLGQTNQEILAKFKMLIAAGISPIICVGETLAQKQAGMTLQILFDQLEAILEFLQSYQGALAIFIAYEPMYAIGTGLVPLQQDLREVFFFLKNLIQQAPSVQNIRLLYGGSVSLQSIADLKFIDDLDGFLIGKASIDFQELKKIVES